MPTRLAVVTDLPTPYRAPLFDLVAGRGVVEPVALYLARRETGRGSWRVDCSGHRHEHLGGGAMTFRARKGPFAWKVGVGVGRRLDAIAPEAVCVGGWAHPAMHLAAAWARRHGVPYLVTSESHPRRHGRLRAAAKGAVARRLVREASAWLPVSARAQALLVELGADPARCFPVPNAPDAERFARARADAAAREATRREHGAVGGEPVTCFVGRLVPAKGVGVLLDAARRLRPDVPATWVVGGGPLKRRLEAVARREGLFPRVRFLGERGYDEVVRLLAAADVVVLPSIHEPYGVSLHEGMAAGCAALASDAVGAAELVEEGASGHVVPAGDAAALAAAWRALLADRERLAERGRRAQARALERGLPFAAASMERAVAAANAPRGDPAPRRVAP